MDDLQQSNTVAPAIISQLGATQVLDIEADLLELPIQSANTTAPFPEDHSTFQVRVVVVAKDGLGCDMPSLRVLTIHGGVVYPAPELPIFAHLTQLTGHGQRVSQLVHFLRHMPHVEDVSVSGLIPDSSTQLSMVAKASLPKLSRLSILSPDICSSRIFDYLEHPNATCIQFVVQSPPQFSLGADLASVYGACSRFSRSVEDGTVSIMCTQMTVSANTFKLSLHCRTSDQPALWCFSFSLPMPFPHMTSSFIQLCSVLLLTEVPSVILTGFRDVPHPEWRQLARLFNRVQSLTFVRCDEEVVNAFLTHDALGRLPLPTLHAINFSESHVIQDDALDSPWRQWGVLLTDTFAERRRSLGSCVDMYWDYVRITDEVAQSCDLMGDLHYSLDECSTNELDW